MTDTLLLAFDDERALAEELAQALGVRLVFVTRHRFPDGELRLVLPQRRRLRRRLCGELRRLHLP